VALIDLMPLRGLTSDWLASFPHGDDLGGSVTVRP